MHCAIDLDQDNPAEHVAEQEQRQATEACAPAAKRLKLADNDRTSSGNSSTGGRPKINLWAFYSQSDERKNKSHFWAQCNACTENIKQSDGKIALRTVESEQTKLDRVLALLGGLHLHFSKVDNPEIKRVMLAGLQRRFADYDQPALIMAYILNPARQTAFLNPLSELSSWKNTMVLAEVLYHRFFPDAKPESGVVDQFIKYYHKEAPFDQKTMQIVVRPDGSPERMWNMLKRDAPELARLALHLLSVTVNAAGCERIFSQMGLTHTKVRNRLGHAKTTQIAQLRQQLHRHRAARQKKKVVGEHHTAQQSSAVDKKAQEADGQLMDIDALLSADEFRLCVYEWFDDMDAEDRLAAAMSGVPAYDDSTAIVKAPLSSIFDSALTPLTDDTVANY